MAEVALITGCATGIGRALALNLHRRSLPSSGQPAFRVFATDYRQEPSSLAESLLLHITLACLGAGSEAQIHLSVQA